MGMIVMMVVPVSQSHVEVSESGVGRSSHIRSSTSNRSNSSSHKQYSRESFKVDPLVNQRPLGSVETMINQPMVYEYGEVPF